MINRCTHLWPNLLDLTTLSDYLLWHTLYSYLPHLLVKWIFFVFTTVQLYWLGIKYLLVELHRRFSSNVRKLRPDDPDIRNDLRNYVAIVTGGSMGIGLNVAKELYRRGCIVVITAFEFHSKEERHQFATNICESVVELVNGGSVHVYDIDLRDLSSVCDFVTYFNDHFDHLDILINNAGVMYVKQTYTVDGFEWHYQVNYLSHVLLTWLLMPALNRANKEKPARIVNVSSSTHYARDLFVKDLQSLNSPYSPFHAYAQSKLCVLMFTYYLADWLAERTEQYHILVNTLHPGVANTALYQNVWWVNRFPCLAKFLFRSPEEGAETVLYAALSSEIKSSGHYFEDCRKIRSSRYSYRKSIQASLAEITAKQLNPIIEQLNRQRVKNICQLPLMFD